MDALHNRRQFLKTGASAAGAFALAQRAFGGITDALNAIPALDNPLDRVSDESFWVPIQRGFDLPPQFTNLEHGYFSMMPTENLELLLERSRAVNTEASYFMRTKMRNMLEEVRTYLADFAGCGPDEIAITRNTTESMNIVIQGLDLKAGDEVILGDQDYGSMVEALKFRAERDGILLKTVEVPLNPESDEEIVSVFEEAITSKTKLMHVTHLINITGHVLPVAKISEIAKSKGIDVLVDSAHGFAHIDYKVGDFKCDFMGTSLHKWLCAPLGLGALYVKKERVKDIQPLIGRIREPDNIRKLDTLGTQPYAAHETIPDCISFHNAIGSELKQERLRYLRQRWVEKVIGHPNVIYNSPLQHERTCAIGNVGIQGMAPKDFAQKLYDDYQIFTVPIGHKRVPGLRITPHLCTRIEEVDRFAEAVLEIAEQI
ncbi:MAG: aminotransferase class V-fold PLP-dependent enzyme [Opitutales bacterium]